MNITLEITEKNIDLLERLVEAEATPDPKNQKKILKFRLGQEQARHEVEKAEAEAKIQTMKDEIAQLNTEIGE